jgi:predicted HTH domain antitoxin
MQAFAINELSKHSLEIIREAKQGHLSLIMQNGEPLFISVPFSENLLKHGVYTALAETLYAEGRLSLGKAAKLAGLPIAVFSEHLSNLGIAIVNYDAAELAEELDYFKS